MAAPGSLMAAGLVASVGVSDLAAARVFYGELLGLELVEQSAYALTASVAGGSIWLTLVGEVDPLPYSTLGWQVDDLGERVAELAGRSIVFERYEGFEQDDLGIWTADSGARFAWFLDPDRNVLSLCDRV